MSTWQLQEAKARFSEVVDSAVNDGPQIITRRGIKTAVVVPFAEWERSRMHRHSLLEALQSGPEFDLNIPPRGGLKTGRSVKL